MGDFFRKFEEAAEYLECLGKTEKNERNCCHKYDFGWRFCAAVNNVKIKICGNKRK